ncbi:hypothetical protein [Rhodococcus sp. (in: high G+C Gram-positive bacteria)]|uniref:hypothetical protein n=1 Tax=Rhodococcus sp. TaxID=1831 RepID=UPI003B8A8209
MNDPQMRTAVLEAFERLGSELNPPFASREEYLADCLDIQRDTVAGHLPAERIRLWIDLLEDPLAAGYREAFAAGDMDLFAAALRHSSALRHAKVRAGGADHSQLYGLALLAAAVHDEARSDALLPAELGPAAHGHPFAVAVTNLIMAIRAGETERSEPLGRDIARAGSRRLTAADQALLSCLTAILERDAGEASRKLHAYARSMSVRKTVGHTALHRVVSPDVHGLFALAVRALGNDAVPPPETGAFSIDFARWQLRAAPAGAFVVYTEQLDEVGELLATVPPRTRLRTESSIGSRLLDAEAFRRDLIARVLSRGSSATDVGEIVPT